MRIPICAAALVAVTGCALPHSDIPITSTELLCNAYTAPLSKSKGDPAILAELVKRGQTRCIDPEVASVRRSRMVAQGFLGPIGGLIHDGIAREPDPPQHGQAAVDVLREENRRLREELEAKSKTE